MSELVPVAALAVAIALAVLLVLVVVVLVRVGAAAQSRDAAAREAADLRARLDALAKSLAERERDIRADLATARREQGEAAAVLRGEVGDRLGQFQQGTRQALTDAQAAHRAELGEFGERLGQLTRMSEAKLEQIRTTVEQKLEAVRTENAGKLEQMRATVDEKLQQTLEQRLGMSFKLVSDQLEQVHRGLGEMQTLATGVGDLKRVLANVKTRGGWGEVQLATLLADLLTPQQYASNVETVPGSGQRVEFAIRLPGRDDAGRPLWLPIDAKLPLDSWQRLQQALERADLPAAEDARREMAVFLRQQAKKIREAYVQPPHTTDFAMLFLPTEGLYAELMARPGLADALQREHRVVLVGPNNFAAIMNSLQMGFRTLAIERRSGEVWKLLAAVKFEFAKFAEILARTQKKLQEASNTIGEAQGKTSTIVRKLRDVEELPEGDSARPVGPLLSLDAGEPPGDAK